ncbi:MAG: hypothetical protein WCE54_14575 [Ignavibacteriaceae bacterium]
MPDSWSKKEERKYKHIKKSEKKKGRSEKRAKEIASRTVNKDRRKKGKTANTKSQGTGNPNKSFDERTKEELYNLAQKRDIKGRSKMTKSELIKSLRKK